SLPAVLPAAGVVGAGVVEAGAVAAGLQRRAAAAAAVARERDVRGRARGPRAWLRRGDEDGAGGGSAREGMVRRRGPLAAARPPRTARARLPPRIGHARIPPTPSSPAPERWRAPRPRARPPRGPRSRAAGSSPTARRRAGSARTRWSQPARPSAAP